MAMAVARTAGLNGRVTFKKAKATRAVRPALSRSSVVVRAQEKYSAIQPINGDPFVGGLETPITSAPAIVWFLSNLPAYRTGVSPLLRGVEIGLTHGMLITGPFIKLGPLRAIPGTAEISGCLASAGVVLILTAALSIYGQAQFQTPPPLGLKTLTGRSIARDPLQSAEGWNGFTAGWVVGGLSGVAWAFVLSKVLPYYS